MATQLTDLALVPQLADRRSAVDILTEQAASRVRELVPVRYARMVATPFTFYRGAAAVMAADLAATPNSGIRTQLCGDAHLSNFGLFFTPERRMAFDLNDFDETYPGPFEWDVKRLAASFVIAAQANGLDDKDARAVACRSARSYRKSMSRSVAESTLECWYAHVNADEVIADMGEKLDTAAVERTRKFLKKARHRDSVQALSKLCVVTDGVAHIRSDPPLLVPIHELFGEQDAQMLARELTRRLGEYRATLAPEIAQLLDQFTYEEAARKVVGVGSVGTRAWIALLVGRDLSDPLFLQMKEAQESVLARYVPDGPSFDNQGRRVVDGQRLMQAASDAFLGWQSGLDPEGIPRDFYVRQLRDGKGSVVIEALEPRGLMLYAKLCGRALAQAHARTASRYAIAEFIGRGRAFEDAIADFAVAYAAINVADHSELEKAIADGRVQAAQLPVG
ncbi:hypothetical protein GOEFS_033_00050 [Gordonia effusa NBRC 100432]|uniref:DUF2252 domain-containing protein n=1 Tax=Gordonia effusa NBRC 100432 TaxID=1077974 RepID=H0QX92_9ACTN|nr:DUF2252 domain-containing protein [Gordonia effusa]GAB17443.1 hypothetical protein GOEFS_033_00050 [Gordonia effusa NBRC 100432]